MRTHTFKMTKQDLALLNGQTISWSLPTSFAEALKPGPDTNGQPYFASEENILQNACAQLNIRKGHAIGPATVADEGKEPEVKTVADAARVAQQTVASSKIRTIGTGKAAKAALAAVTATVSKVAGFKDSDLVFMVENQIAGFEAAQVEIDRRKSAGTAPAAPAAPAKAPAKK